MEHTITDLQLSRGFPSFQKNIPQNKLGANFNEDRKIILNKLRSYKKVYFRNKTKPLPNTVYFLCYLYVSVVPDLSHLRTNNENTEVLVKQLSELRKNHTVKKVLTNNFDKIDMVEFFNEMENQREITKREAHNIKIILSRKKDCPIVDTVKQYVTGKINYETVL